jgi:hypothetical protein
MPRTLRNSLAAIFVITCCLGLTYPTVNAQTQVQAGQILISELRLRGPAGAEDEFIEIYNNTDQPIVVQALDASAGWTVAISNGQITGPVCPIPNGTLIPARGHFLCANSNGYSLSEYPSGNPLALPNLTPTQTQFAATTPDGIWSFDIPDGSGVALFATTNGLNFTAATRLDAFGYSSSPALYREGTGFTTITTANSEHTYYRDLKLLTPKDTNDNAADFRLVGTSISLQVSLLGAPGPENLNSPPLNRNINATLLDPAVSSSQPPNRERRPTVEPNADLGTLLIRRTLTNFTGQPVSRLRFRVIEITSLGLPAAECVGCADVRALTSLDGESASGGQVVTVRGIRLEEPPSQPSGGGLNASLSADFITLATPLLPGESVNIVFKLGVMRTGNFRFYVVIEAQTGVINTTSSKRKELIAVSPETGLEGQILGPVSDKQNRSTLNPATGLMTASAQALMQNFQRNAPTLSKSSPRAKRVTSKRQRRARR